MAELDKDATVSLKELMVSTLGVRTKPKRELDCAIVLRVFALLSS